MLLNDVKVNDLVTLTLTFKIKIAFSVFATRGILFYKHILYKKDLIITFFFKITKCILK